MECSQRAIEQVVHPTAAFPHNPDESPAADSLRNHARQLPWEHSLLNPKNRVDSLELLPDPLWRIDGCAGLGTQYYALPLFMSQVPPMRMDVFIPGNQPAHIREQLDLDVAFHTKDAKRLSRLAITRHIIRALQYWTTFEFPDLQSFETFYRRVPFGTRIVFENLSLDRREIRVLVGHAHDLEMKLLTRHNLESLWGTKLDLLQEVDFYDVHVVSILHDSVCIVRIHGQLYIFKALVSDANKYLYHELKNLYTLEPHPNIIARPIHIVRKTLRFGTKKAIVGFTTFYHEKGSLRDVLPQLRIHDQLRRSEQVKWSIQLAQALHHLRTSSQTYYPDLRLDNIVLSAQSDVVMVDFEQRGVWCEFASPEVNAIEYIRLIAGDEKIPQAVTDFYEGRLEDLVPSHGALDSAQYANPEHGYNVSWIALSPREQEAAEVYMLGRVLWCIFEGVSGPQKAAVWQSYRWESDLEFPRYDRTPPEMRDLIDRCTRGRRAPLSSVIVRRQSQLAVRDLDDGGQTVEGVRAVAQRFWRSELDAAESFLDMRKAQKEAGTWNDNYYDRPTIQEVLAGLAAFEEQSR
ncbi:hypothetical protein F5Y15DRAFT_358562 [Xylariaceae sp. FL0016]|nr:hypothetical protein F5Y15DRAFT_358562 [Xylariaceae sp. FL0016]